MDFADMAECYRRNAQPMDYQQYRNAQRLDAWRERMNAYENAKADEQQDVPAWHPDSPNYRGTT
jgi:hypothetical protein